MDLMSLYWWLSFVDPRRPAGQRFLGVSILRITPQGAARADQRFRDEFGRTPSPEQRAVAAAIETAWLEGCNPGGEVQAVPLAPDFQPSARFLKRLLTKEEADMAQEAPAVAPAEVTKPEDIVPGFIYEGGTKGERRYVVSYGAGEQYVIWGNPADRLVYGGFAGKTHVQQRDSFARWAIRRID